MATPIEIACRSHTYGARATARQIQDDIRQLRELDKQAEKLQARWLAITIAGGLLVIGGWIVGIVTEFANPWIFGSMLLPGLAVLVSGVVMYLWQSRGNYDDKRYDMLHAILDLLGRDTSASELLNVQLDLRKPNDPRKFLRNGRAGPWKVRHFTDPWLQLHGRLLDGTVYRFRIVTHFQQRDRWKTNRRGKWKHKTKTKSATTWELRLRAKREKHPNIDQLTQDIAGAVQLPPWVMLKSVAAAGNSLVLKASAKTDWSVPMEQGRRPARDGLATVAMMFLSLYQVLNLSRRITKAQDKGTP